MANESPAAVIVDEDGNPVFAGSAGQYRLLVVDLDADNTQQAILNELRRIRVLLEGTADR